MRRLLLIPLLLFGLFTLPGVSQAQQKARIWLAGYKIVPSVPSPASSVLDISLQGDTLRVEGDFSELTSNYWWGGIFHGEDGERGNRIFRLEATLNEGQTSGVFEPKNNSFVLNAYQKEALQNGELYVSIASYQYQRGEIRAQIPPMR